jgi:AcrR family transcriptional regulator
MTVRRDHERPPDGHGVGRGGTRVRADAQRSIAAILDATLDCLDRNPDVNMSTIARAAGVGRTTLYTHFPSRDELIDAAVTHAVSRADAAIKAEPLDHLPAHEALARLIRSSWRSIGGYGGLLTAVARHLDRDHFHHQHLETALARIDALIARGQDEGVFRTDLPRDWLVTTFHTLLHTAVHEVEAGRLDAETAPDVVAATLTGALRRS